MKLRIARKIDPGGWQRRARRGKDKRTWWTVHTDETLRRAVARLRTSWRRLCPLEADGGRRVSEDFFASNRVESILIRQRTIRELGRSAP